jgi:pimeloyl-ACP methyl ester carboxylesterase
MNPPPLVLLHGYPFDRTMWERVLVALGKEVKTIAPDLRGFGNIPAGNDEPSLDVMADDVARRLDRGNVPRAVLAGFSLGGYVALAFAERHRPRLAGLALINSTVLPDTEEGRAGRRAMIEKVRVEGPQAAAEAAIPKMFSTANSQNPDLGRFVREGAERAGVDGITWSLEAMRRRPDRTAIFEQLEAPRLIIHTPEDQFIPVERARNLAKHTTKAAYVEIPNAGHASPLEAPEAVADALSDLLKRC